MNGSCSRMLSSLWRKPEESTAQLPYGLPRSHVKRLGRVRRCLFSFKNMHWHKLLVAFSTLDNARAVDWIDFLWFGLWTVVNKQREERYQPTALNALRAVVKACVICSRCEISEWSGDASATMQSIYTAESGSKCESDHRTASSYIDHTLSNREQVYMKTYINCPLWGWWDGSSALILS